MKKLLYCSFFFTLINFQILFAQTSNVGIGTTNPTEKLDVNGNINLTGSIKVNGQDGAAGQVLMKNASGLLSWGSLSEYKNYKVFGFTFLNATQNFTIPAGVTKVAVELWSGGGGGSIAGGGGSGAYAYCVLDVFPGGTLSMIVGGGGQGGFSGAAAGAGGSTQVSFSSLSLGLSGGNGASVSFPGAGGFFNSGSGSIEVISYYGQTGRKNQLSYQQRSSTEFVLYTKYGDGGVAPFQPPTGGEGGQSAVSTTTGFTLNEIFGGQGYGVGEGGGGGLSNGYPGAAGRVIVRW